MAYTVKDQARIIEVMAEALRKRELDFDKIPFDSIMNTVQSMYDQTLRKGEEFVLLYGKQISKGLEKRDYEAVADVLQMISYHFTIQDNLIGILRKTEKELFEAKCKYAYEKNLRKLEKREQLLGRNEYIPFQGKGVVYSAITGGYDNVKEPKCVTPELDYVLFTDNPNIQSKVWKIRLIENPEHLDNVRLARRIKILGHEYLTEYDYSVWVDGSLEIVGDMKEYIDSYKRKEPMISFNHRRNECIYQEVNACTRLKKDDVKIMEKQMERYRREGFPENCGMTESGVIVRDIHNEKIKIIMQAWWDEIKNGSRRDQLSLNYVCWKYNFMYDTCDLPINDNQYVKLRGHN